MPRLVVDVGTFAVMGIHTSPKAAEKELDALVKAYEVTAQALDVQVSRYRWDFCQCRVDNNYINEDGIDIGNCNEVWSVKNCVRYNII